MELASWCEMLENPEIRWSTPSTPVASELALVRFTLRMRGRDLGNSSTIPVQAKNQWMKPNHLLLGLVTYQFQSMLLLNLISHMRF